VLLHGYGSNELDLLGLADQLDPRLHVVSVRGPISLGQGAFAWFDLDWDENGIRPNEAQAVTNLHALIEFLATLPETLNLRQNLTVGGFSQGAMMALGVALNSPNVVSRLVMLSGRVVPTFIPSPPVDLSHVRAIVQHGLQDQILSFEGSREAVALLRSLGATVDHREYDMAHQVSPASLADLKTWLAVN